MGVGLSHQEQTVYFEAEKQGYRLLDVPTVRDILHVSDVRSRQVLSGLARKGAARRIGRGKYALVSPGVVASRKAPVDPYLVVDELMVTLGLADDYYVAFASALKLHHVTEQVPLRVFVATTRRLHSRRIGSADVQFPLLARRKFFGREAILYRDTRLWVSEIEKTLLDCLDRPALAGGIDEVARSIRTAWARVDQSRLLEYTSRLSSQAVAQRLGYILDRIASDKVGPDLRQGLLAQRSDDAVLLDQRGELRGEIDHVWRIRRNLSGTEVLS